MAAAATTSPPPPARQIPIVCPGHTRPLAELQFCHVSSSEEDRTLLVSACHDKLPMMRDGISGDWIGTWSGHKGAVWSCRLDRSGNLAATASGDFSVKVWDAITGQALWTLPHKHIVKSCDFSPDSKKLATGGHEGILRIYDFAEKLASAKAGQKKDPILEIEQIVPAGSKKVAITKLVWIGHGTVLAADSAGSIQRWKVESGIPTEPQLTIHVDAEVRDMEFSELQQMLTVAAGSKVYFFDTQGDMKLLHAYDMPIHFRDEGGASLHPSGKKFVAGGSDLWVRVFDFETGQELECHKGHHGPIRCCRYAPDGKTYATGSEDGTIRLWKTDV